MTLRFCPLELAELPPSDLFVASSYGKSLGTGMFSAYTVTLISMGGLGLRGTPRRRVAQSLFGQPRCADSISGYSHLHELPLALCC